MAMTADVPLILWYGDVGSESSGLVGGKFESLAEMASAEFAVPLAFAVTTSALARFMAAAQLEQRAAEVRQIDPGDLDAIALASAEMTTAIESAALPDDVEAAIRDAYARLERETGHAGAPVAVRSSGVAEDLAGASFAGQYETYLWVQGADEVLLHVRRCWAGLFSEPVLTYRPDALQGGRMLEAAGMGVVVQRMVDAGTAGVAFSIDPVSGDRSKIVIEAAWGLGEAVVSGEVTPDRFRVDKVTLEVIERAVSDKAVEFRFEPGAGARLADVPDERRSASSLDDAEIERLAALVKRIERHRGAPQDVEWAIDRDGEIAVLQVRPETVWSQRAAAVAPVSSANPLDLVLGTFMGDAAKREDA